jgi:glyoxylase-like metal-dependent hydrolase (beta-lactamase superfamily II)
MLLANKPDRSFIGRGACLAALLLALGCTGDEGRQGPVGPTGPEGAAGPEGPGGTSGELDPNLTAWEKALAGIGGEEALDSLASFSIEASGSRAIAGEGYRAGDPAVTVDYFDTTVSHDIAGDNLRVDWMRNWLFLGGQGNYSELIQGQLGYVTGIDAAFGEFFATTNMPSARWAAIRKQHRLLNPQLILQDIAANPSIASEAGAGLHNGVIHEKLVVQDSVYPITLWVNASNGRIAKLTTMENDQMLRDIPLEVHYHDWDDLEGGVAFPRSVYLVLGPDLIHEEYRSDITVNPDLASTLFDFPDGADPMYVAADAAWGRASHQFHQSLLSLGLPLDVPQTYVMATQLRAGVWFLTGGSHNSMVVEQANGVVVIEPPLYNERSRAILDWIAAEPSLEGKSVTHVIVTHFHHDHAAGVREFAAEGAIVVASAASKDFYTKILSAPSTIWPDTLAQSPVPTTITTVPAGGSYTVDDATNPVTAYHIASGHANDLIMIYLENGGYLFESDLYNPGNGGQAIVADFAVELLEAIWDYAPETTTVVGGHAWYAPLSELEAYVANL